MSDVIFEGRATNQYDHREYPYAIKLLDSSYFDKIINIEKNIFQKYSSPETYVLLKENQLDKMLNNKGMVVGFFVDEELYGFCGVYYPGLNRDNLGLDIGLPPQELEKVIQLEASIVDPMYRGNSIQYKMASLLVRRVKCIEDMRYLLNTVSPENYPSLKTTFSLDMFIIKLCVKYNNLWRYIFYQDIEKPIKINPYNLTKISNIQYDNQVQLLSSGYYGCKVEKSKNRINIYFGKK